MNIKNTKITQYSYLENIWKQNRYWPKNNFPFGEVSDCPVIILRYSFGKGPKIFYVSENIPLQTGYVFTAIIELSIVKPVKAESQGTGNIFRFMQV